MEQQILKHNIHIECNAIERVNDGLDFQFFEKSQADKFISFLKNILPLDIKTSNSVKGQDLKSMIYDTRFSYSLKIPSISRQDLILLPKFFFNNSGHKMNFGICLKISKKIKLIDPFNGLKFNIESKSYWTHPFESLLKYDRLKRFIILNKEDIEIKNDYLISDLEITDEDTFNERIISRTCFGNIFNIGDICLVYDLRSESLINEAEKRIKINDFSGIIIVGKGKENIKKNKIKTLAPILNEDDIDFLDFVSFFDKN